ncbi:MAG: cytochrome C peroxidase, partial [Blastocatellia bacterium]|nr:cytochrome C peroxidase [Blastocatellia bacterium]
QSCASCHFHAGADSRSKNQLNPGCLDCPGGPDGFQLEGPNYQLEKADYPFHKLEKADDRDSKVKSDINDVASSLGVFLTEFIDIVPGTPVELGRLLGDPTFNVGGVNVRRVEPRNTPTVINAVFNFRNFWDGRAQDIFNGVNPFGLRDPNAKVLLASSTGDLAPTSVRLNNSSLASQAVGPPLSNFEMSFEGRTFNLIGKKMLSLVPLAKQEVASDDSVLGRLRHASGKGLNTSYGALIKKAFQSKWWSSPKVITVHSDGALAFAKPTGDALTAAQFTQMEYNFSLFFGLAIQMYEATLISDQTPLDRFLAGDKKALTKEQQAGLSVFQNEGKCINCHSGPELSGAVVSNVKNERLERMIMGDGGQAVYDNGFYNIGVRPTQEDLGVGRKDPFGNPLAESRIAQLGLNRLVSCCLNLKVSPNERVAVDGSFKTAQLRNIELTAPYFHNGGQLTLKQVVEFYNRGGDFHDENINNLDPDIEALGLSGKQRDVLVKFLLALTDERVRLHCAPFDHPQLFVPNGHPKDHKYVADDGTGKGVDSMLTIPAVGRKGLAKPLKNFLE